MRKPPSVFIEHNDGMAELSVQRSVAGGAYVMPNDKYYVAIWGQGKKSKPYDKQFFDTVAEADRHFDELIAENGWDSNGIEAAI